MKQLIIILCVLVASCNSKLPEPLLYNAYSPLYDEFFIIKSDTPLEDKAVVWFNDNAEVVNYTTPYVATIISPYND